MHGLATVLLPERFQGILADRCQYPNELHSSVRATGLMRVVQMRDLAGRRSNSMHVMIVPEKATAIAAGCPSKGMSRRDWMRHLTPYRTTLAILPQRVPHTCCEFDVAEDGSELR